MGDIGTTRAAAATHAGEAAAAAAAAAGGAAAAAEGEAEDGGPSSLLVRLSRNILSLRFASAGCGSLAVVLCCFRFRCLRSYDLWVNRIICQVSFVALYRLDLKQKKWIKMHIMGGLHLTQRRIPQGAPLGASAAAGEGGPPHSGGPRKRAPSSGMLMLRSHEQPITAEMYLRYGGDKGGAPPGGPPAMTASGARVGAPQGAPLGAPPPASFLQASEGVGGAIEPTAATAATTAAAAAATVKYRMFILNQCKEEIFFQDIDPDSDFVVEAGPNHLFYKTPDEHQQGQPAVYALWMYDDNERVRLEAALRELLQPDGTAAAAAAAAAAAGAGPAAAAETARLTASGSSSIGAVATVKSPAASGMQQQQQQQQQEVLNDQALHRTESEGEKAGRALLSLLTGGVPVPAPFCSPVGAAEDVNPCAASHSAPAAAAAAAAASAAADGCSSRAQRRPLDTSKAIISLLQQQQHLQHEQQQMIRHHGNRSHRQQQDDVALAACSAPALRAPEEPSPNSHAAAAAAAEAPPLSLPKSPSSFQGSANWSLLQMLKVCFSSLVDQAATGAVAVVWQSSLPGPIAAPDTAAAAAAAAAATAAARAAKDEEEELLLVSRSGLKKAVAAALRSDDFQQLLWRELQLQQQREQQQQQQQQRRR
ncbi:hypothetical protein ACSSS7_006356 [Eimeria intestinalis]